MTDIAQELREVAGALINGSVEDGAVPTALLVRAADELDRLHVADRMSDYWRKQYDLLCAHIERIRAALNSPADRANSPTD